MKPPARLLFAVGLALAGCGGDRPATASAQLAHGKLIYEGLCAHCHVAEGGFGNELSREVLADYASAERLYRYHRKFMPYRAEGTLSDRDAWDVTAFVLREYGFLGDGVLLTPENAPRIRLKR